MADFSNTLFLFTTTPAGLGHIRVMDAIKDGRPNNITSVDLGILDIKANRIHDLGSRVKFFRDLTEFYQTNKVAEAIVTFLYADYLHKHTKKLVEDLTQIAKQYPNYKKWVVVSTHFALAHSISAVKEKLEKKLGVKIYLCVVVTDDSPQKIWAVSNSDITFTASNETREKLAKFFPRGRGDTVKTIPFPIAPRLAQNLNLDEFKFVVNQLSPAATNTQIVVPVSGAAVQLKFFEELMGKLCRNGFDFTVIGQESILTKMFFEKTQSFPHVQLSIGKDAWQTVTFYESLFYQARRPAIEITKPSEQAFKAILNPRQRGGVIILLTSPIGRQEYDNLNFLVRFGLMPTADEQKQLFIDEDLRKWTVRAKNWRAIRIPDDPIKAANFISKLKSSGLFYSMLSAVIPSKPELMDNGVKRIWEEIEKLI